MHGKVSTKGDMRLYIIIISRFYSFMWKIPNVFFHPYQLVESIFNFRVVWWYFSFYQILKDTSVSKQWRT